MLKFNQWNMIDLLRSKSLKNPNIFNHKGFTITELGLIILVFSILSFCSILELRALNSTYKCKSENELFTAFFNRLQTISITNNQSVSCLVESRRLSCSENIIFDFPNNLTLKKYGVGGVNKRIIFNNYVSPGHFLLSDGIREATLIFSIRGRIRYACQI